MRLEYLLMNRPNITAATATNGTTDNINKVSFILSLANNAIPPIIKINGTIFKVKK